MLPAASPKPLSVALAWTIWLRGSRAISNIESPVRRATGSVGPAVPAPTRQRVRSRYPGTARKLSGLRVTPLIKVHSADPRVDAIDARRVPAPDDRHLDDLTADEFDAAVFARDEAWTIRRYSSMGNGRSGRRGWGARTGAP